VVFLLPVDVRRGARSQDRTVRDIGHAVYAGTRSEGAAFASTPCGRTTVLGQSRTECPIPYTGSLLILPVGVGQTLFV
jgi:hypothetical protein